MDDIDEAFDGFGCDRVWETVVGELPFIKEGKYLGRDKGGVGRFGVEREEG